MSAPWMKFYPRDWRGDQALRAVSLSARGLWIECLCIMHEAKPYGHLVLNGAPVDGGTLARMTGVPVDEVSALLAELRQAGVLSVTGKGVVFSRRMTKDHARAQKGRKAADKRWSQASDDVEQSEAPNGSPNGLPTTQKPETREQIDKPIAQHQEPPRAEPMLLDRLFKAAGIDGFREERHPGLLKLGPIRALLDKGYSLDADILPVITDRARNKTFSSWGFFTDAIVEAAAAKSAIPQRAAVAGEDWPARLDVWRQDRTWSPSWGPAPDEPKCRAPAELLKAAA